MSLRQQTLTVAILAFAACVASVASAQPDLDAAADRQRQLVAGVELAEAHGGPNSEELIEPLASLAMFHQEAGDRDLAAAVIERLVHVVRVNYGLHSLAQAPLLTQLIANEQEAGNAETAWALQDDLLALARHNPDDLSTVAIFREVADQRLKQMGLGKLPLRSVCRGNEMVLGCSESSGANGWHTTSVHGLVFAGAMNNWADAIRVLVRNEMYGSPELRELEEQLIKWGNCDVARDSYRRLMAYDAASGETWLKRAATIVRAADSELVCSQARPAREDAALELYREAHDVLERNGAARASIDEMFAPEVPIKLWGSLPATAYSMDSMPAEGSAGYVAVTFEITKHGRARNVEIVDTTANTADDQKRRAVELVRKSLYRPRVVDGEIADAAQVLWRYYY